MLNLLQHKHKFYFLIRVFGLLIVIFAVENVAAYSFGVSPPSINLNFSSIGEKCTDFTIYGKNSVVDVADYWSLKDSRDIADYNLESVNGVIASYVDKISVKDKKPLRVCFNVLARGMYYGVLIFSPENSSAEVGVWIKLSYGSDRDIVSDKVMEDKPDMLTGNVVDLSERDDDSGISLAAKMMFGSTVVFFIVLIVGVYWLFRVRREGIV
jgi:hypothetical protein